MSDTIIGIDLGTTNSEVAVVHEGRVEVLEIETGTRLLPSVVGLDDAGMLLVGQPAKNQAALYPERTVRSVKRRMGSDETIALGDQHYSPQEISALILRRLKTVAEAWLGKTVMRAVITVPAYFSDAQRQATREAGEIAGLDVARIINEPTAAALAYEAGAEQSRQLLVYDLGGGTFDVSVVAMEAGVVEVRASHGNNHLGGDDFDTLIIEHLLAHLQQEHGVDARQSTAAIARLQRAAENAKIALSDRPYANIEEEYLLEKDGRPVNLSLELARSDYEAMIESYVEETLEAMHTALSDAGLTSSDLDEVLLVGGATRTPIIAQRLEAELGLAPRGDIDPDLCVAAGAASQAAVIAGAPARTVLVDITPYTFGTSAIAELNGQFHSYCFVPIIRKNTPIPVTKSEVFYTAYDGQETVDVEVYQGEDPDALNNTQIGKFRIEGLRDAPAGNPVIMTCALDLDGILSVTAREKDTGLEKSIRIDRAVAGIEPQGIDDARQRIGRLLEGETIPDGDIGASADQPTGKQAADARALIDKAERLMENANAEDREDLVDGVEQINEALTAGDAAAVQPALEQLSDLIYFLEA
ncbi:MAG: Hsp70 family protein [Salinisphaera sp.]|jgi:molecular chaperone DnaK|nr:Hsp70 family protein [Salinisphaera sp.]